MTGRWIGKEGVMTMAVVAMFLFCTVPACIISDSAYAEDYPEIDPGFNAPSELFTEGTFGDIGMALMMLESAFPMDIGEFLRLFAGHFESSFVVPDGIEDRPGSIVLDKSSSTIPKDCTTLILKDGAKLNLKKDLVVENVIVAGNATITSENGSTLTFDRFSFGNLAVYDDNGTDNPFIMAFDGKALFTYGYETITSPGSVPNQEDVTISIKASFDVDGKAVTVTQYRDVVEETTSETVPFFGIFTDWINYTEIHTVIDREYTVDTYRFCEDGPVCSFTLDADLTAPYLTFDDYLDGFTDGFTNAVAELLDNGFSDMPNIDTSFYLNNTCSHSGYEHIETYDYDFGIWKKLDGFVPKEGSYSNSETDSIDLTDCSVSLRTDSWENSVNFKAGLSSCDVVNRGSSDRSNTLSIEGFETTLTVDHGSIGTSLVFDSMDVDTQSHGEIRKVDLDGISLGFTIGGKNLSKLLKAIAGDDDIDISGCFAGMTAHADADKAYLYEFSESSDATLNEANSNINENIFSVSGLRSEVGVNTSFKGNVSFTWDDLSYSSKESAMKALKGDAIDAHSESTLVEIDGVLFTTSAGLGSLTDAIMAVRDRILSDDSEPIVPEVARILFDRSGFSAQIELGSLSVEKVKTDNEVSNVTKVSVGNDSNGPAALIDLSIVSDQRLNGFNVTTALEAGLTAGSKVHVEQADSNAFESSRVYLDIDGLNVAMANPTVVIPLQFILENNIPEDLLDELAVFDISIDARFGFENMSGDVTESTSISIVGADMRFDLAALTDDPYYMSSEDFAIYADELVVDTHEGVLKADGAVFSNINGNPRVEAITVSVDGTPRTPSTDAIYVGNIVIGEKEIWFNSDRSIGTPVWIKPVPFTAPVRIDGSNTISVDIYATGNGPVTIGNSVIESLVSGMNASDEGNKAQLKLDCDGRTSIALNLSGDAIKSIADKSADLEIQSGVGSVNLGVSTLQSVLGVQGADVSLSLASLEGSSLTEMGVSEDLAEQVGDSPVIAIDLSVGGNAVHNLNGTATITVPYDGGDYARITVYYLDPETNSLQPIRDATYDPETRTVTFSTTHFSMYSIGDTAFDDVDPALMTLFIIIACLGMIVLAVGVARLSFSERKVSYPY